MGTELYIFDLDGTLLDSIDDIAFSMNDVLARNGFPTHAREAYFYFVGNGARLLTERALPEHARTAEQVDSVMRQFMAFYDLHKADQTHPYPGLVPTMKALQSHGAKFAVASNKPHEVMPDLMRRYFPEISFSVVLGHRKGHPIKPDPEIVRDILSVTGTEPEKVLYIGDTAVDVNTAHAAGLRMAGALWGYRTREELVSAGADLLLERPESLLAV
jgi:phosphoglycolate phosphatase